VIRVVDQGREAKSLVEPASILIDRIHLDGADAKVCGEGTAT
jgi:hypothetical protein